jgi:peptide/nickel transport system substrate-binding protein
MGKRYWAILIISIFVIVTLMAACSSTATTAPQAPVISITSAPPKTSITPVSTTSAPTTTLAVKKGGTLKIGTSTESTALGSPEAGSVSTDGLLSGPAIEQLSRIDDKGNISPWLADSWKADPQAATVTLTLKKGVKFHDGTIMDAAAIKADYEWLMPMKTTSTKNIKSIDIVDDYTIRLNLVQWNADAVSDVTSLFVVSPTAFKTQGDTWGKQNPVGTGPFKIVSHQIDTSIKYTAFNDYWGGKPNLEGIEFTIIKDQTTRFNSFKAGEIDVDLDPSIAQLQEVNGNSKYVVRDSKGLGNFIMLIPDGANADSPSSKLQVRQAMGYAINRDSLVKNILGGCGMVANQQFPVSTWGGNPDLKSYTFDPAKAKQLLAEAGYSGGIDITLTCTTRPYETDLVNAMQAMLADVGIRAKINQVAFPAFIQQTAGWKNGVLYAMMPPNPNRLSYSSTYVYDVDPAGSVGYKSVFKSPEITAAIAKANAAVDIAARQPLVWQWADLVYNKYAQVIPVVITDSIFIAYPYVKDLNLYTAVTPNAYHVETAWLDR